ncbi:MAG: BspA family leucine-rich repeat surface protein [Spirochaetales bacterium]|nr:BspA family leucine-rich repeat surface protein [Spirochaetales bacterium]
MMIKKSRYIFAILCAFALFACQAPEQDIIESANAELESLEVSVGTLMPEFDPEVTAYSVFVPYETEAITITGIVANDAAEVGGVSGIPQALAVGSADYTVTVTAEYGNTQDYTVTVTRPQAGAFVSVWNTYYPGLTEDNQIELPLTEGGAYDFHVDWGDGCTDHITAWDDTAKRHTYDSTGFKVIAINGNIRGFSFGSTYEYTYDDPYHYYGDSQKLLRIDAWGVLNLGNSGLYFCGCQNLNIGAWDMLDLSGTSDLTAMFYDCVALDFIPNIESWDVSGVTCMKQLFAFTPVNPDIRDWDVSHVTDMTSMFRGNSVFNADIGDWDVSSVTLMAGMFRGANSFNQDIGDWDVSAVTTMGAEISDYSGGSVAYRYGGMFQDTYSFNQDISEWDVSSVTNMAMMFDSSHSFNQNIGNWNVEDVTDMRRMFYFVDVFDQDLGNWDVSGVTQMDDMFENSTLSTANYNALLNGWSSLPALQPDVVFDGGLSRFSAAAQAARDSLENDHGWSITDGGLAP